MAYISDPESEIDVGHFFEVANESSDDYDSDIEEPINKIEVDLMRIDSLDDGAVKVELFNFRNGRFMTMKVMLLGKDEHTEKIVKSTNPVVLDYDCRVGQISQLGEKWLSKRHKVCLRNVGENEKINLQHLNHVTHMRIENVVPLGLQDILPHLGNVIEMTVTGPTQGCS